MKNNMKSMTKWAWVALVAMVSIAFSACSSDDPQKKEENKFKEQTVVNEIVAKQKKHEKALLLIAFGSTWEEPQKTFGKMQEAFKKAFPDMDLYFSFTSTICINKLRAEGKQVYYRPQQWLTAIGEAGYKEVNVQSLHIVPGEEYLEIQTEIKNFHFTPEYGKIVVYAGAPLLAEKEDVEEVAKILHAEYKDKVEAGNIVAFMGHGNPETHNYGNGNSRYLWIEEALQKLNAHYYVSTVDMENNFVADMWKRMEAKGDKTGTVYCAPLMSVAGDHANNDMTGGRNAKAEEDSWRDFFTQKGYNCPLANCKLIGLGDYPQIVDIWVRHLKEARQAEPMYDGKE